MASSIFLNPALGITSSGGSITALFADGTSGAPSMAFLSEPTLGFWRSGAGAITAQGALNTSGALSSGTTVTAATFFRIGAVGSAARVVAVASGLFSMTDNGAAVGAAIKVDALPTIASGFGAGAAVTAGSTPFAGSIGVGTTAGSTGVINFNGTAFPGTVYPICMNQTTGLAVKATASSTQLTIAPATGTFGDNDVISWICISSK